MKIAIAILKIILANLPELLVLLTQKQKTENEQNPKPGPEKETENI